MDYVKIITEVLLVMTVGAAVFILGPDVSSILSQAFSNPCNNPIVYSIGTIDSGFNVSDSYFLSAIKEAEGYWEKASGKNLFEYSEGKGMEMNLVYDYRQSTTSQINKLNNVISSDEAYYDSLKSEYDGDVSQYEANKSKINSLVIEYNQSRRKNSQLISQINSLQQTNSDLANKINELAGQINALAAKYNLNVDNYNNIADSLDSEFEQGNYVSSSESREINIYQFDNHEKLVSVLVHEMGHALGLDHVDNPEDIMYSVNAGEGQSITSQDLTALNAICSQSAWEKLLKRQK
jgi:hypothetical protein